MRFLLAVVCLATVGGCATQRLSPNRASAVAPALSVETFLQAAHSQDFEGMSRVFGTADGPIGDTGSAFGCGFKKLGSWIGLSDRCITWAEVELRMSMIADVLQAEDYQLGGDTRVAGRTNPTTRVDVTLVQNGKDVRGIPFVVVQGKGGGWYVEEIGLDRVTAAR